MMPTPQQPPAAQPSDSTTRSFTLFLVPPPPPMTVFVQLSNGTQLQFTPPPEHLLSSLFGGAPLVFPLNGSASTATNGFWPGTDNDAMVRAMHELFARSQSEQHGPPPTSKAFLDTLPLRTWDAAACASEKYTDCPICLSEFETADTVLALPCGHAFHRDCGLPWLTEHNVCPTCRYQLPTLDKPTTPASTQTTTPPVDRTPESPTEPEQEPEQEPAFEQMLRSLLGVRRERSSTISEPIDERVVRQRVDASAAMTLPGTVASDAVESADADDDAIESMLEDEANRFVEEQAVEKKLDAAASTATDSDAAMFDDVDLEELLRDASASA